LAVLVLGGLACLLLGRRKIASHVGAAAALAGSATAMVASLLVLLGRSAGELTLAWPIPFGSFRVGMDGLSAFFAVTLSLITALAAVYGVAYLRPFRASSPSKNLGATWFFYNLLTASMLLVVASRNGVLFLLAWEIMSLASFFLVMFEDEKPATLSAGWVYLVATHLGTAFLLALFVLMSGPSMDFAAMPAGSAGLANACFLLAVAGFGTKAGFVPLHVWLPEAHPAAPSHVSAVMSGVMIKLGIYGLLRTLTLLPASPAWWGWTLVGIGAVSGIGGVLMALAQHDLKRLLAYHSVENIGIIAMGLGLGLLGISTGNDLVAVLGIFGALLHVWNHALFKSLLFLCAGAVVHATGTRDIEQMGGLIKRMPTTGATFLIGSASICGLPPLNGFLSELAIYLAAFFALTAPSAAKTTVVASLVVIASLALIGGLAAACFAKAFGAVFLGLWRKAPGDHDIAAHEAPLAMRGPMLVLAGLCVLTGLAGPLAIAAFLPATMSDSSLALQPIGQVFSGVGIGVWALLALIVGVAILRRKLLAGRTVTAGPTWDCGYVASAQRAPRIQYTASSLAAPILFLFRSILRPRVKVRPPQGLFPQNPSDASLHTHVEDFFLHRVFGGLFGDRGLLARLSGAMRWLQAGPNQLYVLYVALAILALLVWKLGGRP
jgi:formate hydrogenlyase subunit 3/multisubunit Na+/H+ antiporter MnhD subunit